MLYSALALLAGALLVINRMSNAKATQVFGKVNGLLVNYIEPTILSFLLLSLIGQGQELSIPHMASVPWWIYLCSITGLVAMFFQTLGTLHTNAVISSVLLMIGNFAMALVLDYVFYDKFSLIKTVGIAFVILGTAWAERGKYAKNESVQKS